MNDSKTPEIENLEGKKHLRSSVDDSTQRTSPSDVHSQSELHTEWFDSQAIMWQKPAIYDVTDGCFIFARLLNSFLYILKNDVFCPPVTFAMLLRIIWYVIESSSQEYFYAFFAREVLTNEYIKDHPEESRQLLGTTMFFDPRHRSEHWLPMKILRIVYEKGIQWFLHHKYTFVMLTYGASQQKLHTLQAHLRWMLDKWWQKNLERDRSNSQHSTSVERIV